MKNRRLFITLLLSITCFMAVKAQNNLQELVTRAESGDAAAMNLLGENLRDGKGHERDIPAAIEWFTKAAGAGNTDAMMNLSYSYISGLGVAADYGKAVHWAERAAKEGNVGGMLTFGSFCIEGTGMGKDIEKGLHYYKKAADMGSSEAMYLIGCYYLGDSTDQKDKAEEWITRAAAAGNIKAMLRLASEYKYGAFGDKPQMSFKWYRMAAQNGSAEGMYYTGQNYSFGTGTAQNISKSFYWFKKAAENNYPEAYSMLSLYFQKGYGTQRDLDKSNYWLERAANETNDASAMFRYAISILQKDSSPADFEKAASFIIRSAENGYIEAMPMAGAMYYDGMGVERDTVMAVQWWTKGASYGDAASMLHMADYYMEDSVPEKNYARGFAWVQKAADTGSPNGINYLGICYYSGMGVAADKKKALSLWKKAGDRNSDTAMLNLSSVYKDKNKTASDLFQKAAALVYTDNPESTRLFNKACSMVGL